MNKKTILNLVILFATTYSLLAQTNMILKFKDGTEKNTLTNSIARITVSDGTFTFKMKNSTTESYANPTIQRLIFVNYTGLTETPNHQTSLSAYPNPALDYIYIKNAPIASAIRILRMDGSVAIKIPYLYETQGIEICSLPKGLYLLKINNQTVKFIKQ
jgi:hypothetical protein